MPTRLIDPTRTGRIVKAFQRDLRKRLRFIATQIRKLIVDEDAFGLKDVVIQTPDMLFNSGMLANNRFRFNTDSEKIEGFNKWLEEQIEIGMLSTSTSGQGFEWSAEYISDSYRKAQVQSYLDAKKQGVEAIEGMTQREFLAMSMAGDHTVAQVRTLYSRTFNELEGMTNDMATRLTRVMADGLTGGLGAKELARDIEKEIGHSRYRAERIARTEIIRSYAESQLDSFESMGLTEVGVMAEWQTAGNPCELCAPLNGVIMTIDEARGLIPRHPNCVVGESIVNASDALTVMRAEYTGQIIEFMTSLGSSLSVTANHILLTQRGWVFAKDIHNGDYLIQSPFVDINMAAPNNNDAQPNISQVFRSFFKSSDKFRITKSLSMPEYFHGDGESLDFEIQIIDMYGELLNIGNMISIKQLCQDSFAAADVIKSFLVRFGSANEFFDWLARTTDGIMGRLGVSNVLTARSILHHQSISGGVVSNGKVALGSYNPSDFISATIESFSDSVLADAFAVEFQNFLNHYGVVVTSVVSHDVSSLPVYDLSTQSTVYSVNGYLTSNCRCAWLPANLPGQSKKGKAYKKPDIDDAIAKSIQAESPKRTAAENLRRSRWVGADTNVAKTRPKGITLESDMPSIELPDKTKSNIDVKPSTTTQRPTLVPSTSQVPIDDIPPETIVDKSSVAADVLGGRAVSAKPKPDKSTKARQTKRVVSPLGKAIIYNPFAQDHDESIFGDLAPIDEKLTITFPSGRKKTNVRKVKRKKQDFPGN